MRYRDADGDERELRAPLVVGADGRRSLVAREVGADEPAPARTTNGRGCYFAYWRDGRPEWRAIAAQWRQGEELVTAFPCDGGLRARPADAAGRARRRLQGRPRGRVRAHRRAPCPELAARLEGCERATQGPAHALDRRPTSAARSGPGWALPGDAGHFKDPVTAQGIRDALRFGRLLGEAAAPALDDPRALDRALRDVGAPPRPRVPRDLPVDEPRSAAREAMNPIEAELYRQGSADPELARSFLDVMARTRSPREVMTSKRVGRLIAGAVRHGESGGAAVIRRGAAEARDAVAESVERVRFRSRLLAA